MSTTLTAPTSSTAPATDFAVRRPRAVERLVTGQATSDGDGVKLTRVLTQPLQRRLDPFLMLDAFGSDDANDYIGGFPDHPHRGFETVTYMIAGRMRHRDSTGNEGLLENGGVQWMTAGRGLIHSELPEQEEGRMEGFQLWLNLPAADKMTTPGYRDIPTGEIPELRRAGATVRVVAGEFEPSRAQRRALARHASLEPRYGELKFNAEHYALYRLYQSERHRGGGMDHDSREQYAHFLLQSNVATRLVEFREGGELRMVSIVDELADGLSSVYTFFDPLVPKASYGTYNILWQIEEARRRGMQYVYLGYWIGQSRKMSYKNQFAPIEGLSRGEWKRLA